MGPGSCPAFLQPAVEQVLALETYDADKEALSLSWRSTGSKRADRSVATSFPSAKRLRSDTQPRRPFPRRPQQRRLVSPLHPLRAPAAHRRPLRRPLLLPRLLASTGIHLPARRHEQVAHLRAAADGARRAWQHAISLKVATDPCELSAALFAHQSRTTARPLEDEVGVAVLVAQGAARFALSDLLAGGLQRLADQWRLSAAQPDSLSSRLRSLVDKTCFLRSRASAEAVGT